MSFCCRYHDYAGKNALTLYTWGRCETLHNGTYIYLIHTWEGFGEPLLEGRVRARGEGALSRMWSRGSASRGHTRRIRSQRTQSSLPPDGRISLVRRRWDGEPCFNIVHPALIPTCFEEIRAETHRLSVVFRSLYHLDDDSFHCHPTIFPNTSVVLSP